MPTTPRRASRGRHRGVQVKELSPGKASGRKSAPPCPLVPGGRSPTDADSGRSQSPAPTFRDHRVPSRAWLKTPRGPPGADTGACAGRGHAQCALGAEGGAPRRTSLRRRRIPVGEEVEDSIRHVGCRRFAITSPALSLKKLKNKERSFLRVSGLLAWLEREPGRARGFFFPPPWGRCHGDAGGR